MSDRDANIAYLKRLKTRYELRAKELELQEIATRYRLDVFKNVPPPLSRGHSHHHRHHSPVVKVTPGYECDDCPCSADRGYNKLCSSRDEEIPSTAPKTDQSDSRLQTKDSSASLDSLDLATLSTIKKLAQWERDARRRIARLEKVEEVVVTLMTGKPHLLKKDEQATVESEPISNFDAEIQSDVERMKDVVDHLALKVKEPQTVEREDVEPSEAVPLTCQPECPLAELSSNLQDAVQYVDETMPAITSSLARIEKIVSIQETDQCTIEEEPLVEADDSVDEEIESISQVEPDKVNSKMETMKRNIDLVVDHLKVCEACPVEEYANINHDLEDILEIFHSIHDAGDNLEETAEVWEDALTEQDGTAMNIIDEIIARASQIVCENIIKETEVSMQQIKQSVDDESTLLKLNELGENLESYEKNQQEAVVTEPSALHAKTNCGCLSTGTKPTQRMLQVAEVDGPVESVLTDSAPTTGESVSCQTVMTFSGRSNVNVTAICISSVAPCSIVSKDEDDTKNVCKCESIAKKGASVTSKYDDGQMPSGEKPIPVFETDETLGDAPALREPTDIETALKSAEEVPLAARLISDEAVLEEIAAKTPSVKLSIEKTTREPSAEPIQLETLVEPGPTEPLPEPTPIEPSHEADKIASIPEPILDKSSPEPAVIPLLPEPTPVEPSSEPLMEPLPEPVAFELLGEATALEPTKKPPAEPMTEESPPVESLAAPVLEEPLALPPQQSSPEKSPIAEPLVASARVPSTTLEPVDQAPSKNVPPMTVTEPASVASKVASLKSVAKSPDPKLSPLRATSSEKPQKLVDPGKSPAKSASSPIVVKPSREKSPIKAIPSPTKVTREKSPVKSVASPIAAKTNRERSPLKGVSSPIAANKPREKPEKRVASPVASKEHREKSPVKSTTSPAAIRPIATNIPGKSGSILSATKPANRKQSPEKISPKASAVRPVGPRASAAKRPSTPSTYKILRPSIGSVGSRNTARSTSSKKIDSLNIGSKGDAPLKRASGSSKSRCACKKRKESPCQKRGLNNEVAEGMCPSSPQRKCLCRRPSSRRESPVKEKVPNDDASAEGQHVQSTRRCFCKEWKKYRESLSKCRGSKDEKDQEKPLAAKRKKCKCKHTKQK